MSGSSSTEFAPSLRVAMIVRRFSTAGGLELYTHKLVEGLVSRNVQVTVICEDSDSAFSSRLLNVVKFGTASGKNKAERTKNLFEAATSALNGAGTFDIVHSQHCPVDGADVVTFHNHTTRRLSEVGLSWERLLNDFKRSFIQAYKLRHQIDETLCRRAKVLIFPAEVMRQDFYSVFPFLDTEVKPYVVAYPGADLANSSSCTPLKPRIKAPNSPFVFLFVGRGFRKKGLDVLLQACKLLKQRGKKFELHIAGLKLKPMDNFRLNLLGIAREVSFLGFCSNMDEVYARCAVNILPSRVEPFGMAPVQAMQRGLVPIVSRVSGVAEALKDKIDSLILQDHLDASELADLMQLVMEDNDLRARLSAAAVLNSQRISWNATTEQTLKAYRLCMESNVPSGTTGGAVTGAR